MLTLKVFLSSPGDVAEERRLAVETVRTLEDSPLLRERVNLIVVAWDDPVAGSPLDARETPQSSVNRWSGRPADCDLTIVVLWSRLGTPLPPTMTRADGTRFASGTVWEVEDAIAADRPVFVYRRTEKPLIDLDAADFDAKRSQYDAVRRWFESLRDADGARTGVNEYATPAQFQQLLRAHLEAFIGRRLAGVAAPGATVTAAPMTVVPSAATSGTASPSATGPSASVESGPSKHDSSVIGASRRTAPAESNSLAGRAAPTTTTTHTSPDARRSWLIPALVIGGVVVGGAIVWSLRSGGTSEPPAQSGSSTASTVSPNTRSSTTEPSTPIASGKTSSPPATPSALPQVKIAGPADATFTAMRGSTYSVLALTPEIGTNAQWRLRLRVRLKTGPQSGGMNFWDSAFRLVVDGVPRAAVSTLNEIVEGGASKEGDIVFAVPWAVQTLALRIHHYAETADLPLAVSGTRASEPPTLPTGPRRVTLDGPAELAFTSSPHAIYTILAVASEARRPGVFGLRVRMRMLVQDRYDANFWDDRFRLLVDGKPLEPDSRLNEVVGGNAAKDADITFEVPETARALVLHVKNNAKDSADVPLKLGPKS